MADKSKDSLILKAINLELIEREIQDRIKNMPVDAPDYDPEASTADYLKGIARKTGQGLAGGIPEMAEGFVRGKIFGQEDAEESVREETQEFEQKFPKASGASMLGGAALQSYGLSKLKIPVNRKSMATAGALEGASQAAVEGEGFEDVMSGALIGGGFGAMAPEIIEGGAKLAKGAVKGVAKGVSKTGKTIGKKIGEVLNYDIDRIRNSFEAGLRRFKPGEKKNIEAFQEDMFDIPVLIKENIEQKVKSLGKKLDTSYTAIDEKLEESIPIYATFDKYIKKLKKATVPPLSIMEKDRKKAIKVLEDIKNNMTLPRTKSGIRDLESSLDEALTEMEFPASMSRTIEEGVYKDKARQVGIKEVFELKKGMQQFLKYGKGKIDLQTGEMVFGDPSQQITTPSIITVLKEFENEVKKGVEDIGDIVGFDIGTMNEKYHNFKKALEVLPTPAQIKTDVENMNYSQSMQKLRTFKELIGKADRKMAKDFNTVIKGLSETADLISTVSRADMPRLFGTRLTPVIGEPSVTRLANVAGRGMATAESFLAAIKNIKIPRTEKAIFDYKDIIKARMIGSFAPDVVNKINELITNEPHNISKIAPFLLENFPDLFMSGAYASEFEGKLRSPQDKMQFIGELETDDSMSNTEKAMQISKMNKTGELPIKPEQIPGELEPILRDLMSQIPQLPGG